MLDFPLIRFTGIYIIAGAISSAIPFFLLPILTRYLSPTEYGIVAMFQLMVSIFGIFIGINLHGAIGRQYFEKDIIDFPQYITNCLFIIVFSFFTVGLLIWILSGTISRFTGYPENWLWAVSLIAVAQCIHLFVLTLWQVQANPIAYGTFQILITICNFGLSLLLIVGFGMNWKGRIVAQAVVFSIFALYGLYMLTQGRWIKLDYNFRYIRHALNFGVPLIPHMIGAWAIAMTDRLLLTNMIGIAETGVYVVGVQIGMIIGLIQSSFNNAWVPWFFEQLKKNDLIIKQRIVRITYFYFIIMLALALILAYFAPIFLNIYVGKAFKHASTFILWLCLGYAFDGMYKMVANYIFYIQKTKILAWITFFTATTNLFLSYALIRYNGPVGAAQGTMCAFFLSFILTWILSSRLYQMPWRFNLVRVSQYEGR